MKRIIMAWLLIISNVMAQDMSRTENYKSAYKENADSTVLYVGKCSTHQDYEGSRFKVSKTLVDYFEPDYNNREQDMKSKIAHLEKELMAAAAAALQFDTLADVDDLTVDKIKMSKTSHLDLYRMNVGVGGGNGVFLVFNRRSSGSKVHFELMSYVMDGDVEYCDALVWQR